MGNKYKIGVHNMNNNLISFFENLGYNHQEVKILSSLGEKGSQSILELSRSTEINRTKVYRLIEDLKKQGLVEEIVDEYRQLVKLVDFHKLDLIIKEKESRTKLIRDSFMGIQRLLSLNQETHQPGTRVIFHRGEEGIRQMVWNTLSAKHEVVGYTYRSINEVVGNKFADEWHAEFINRNLVFRDIYSDHYLQSVKKHPHEHNSLERKHFHGRYIAKNILDVNHQVDIYNDVVAYYNWFEGEVFGVEIYSEKVALLQKQLFEIVWKIAKEETSSEYS